MSDAAIEVRDLRTCFGPIAAVDGASMRIETGTITGLIGPNGAGKSTLFHSITGVTRASEGHILFEGQLIDGLSPDRLFRRGLAHTFQLPRPFPRMSVLDNVMLAPGKQTGESLLGALFAPSTVAREEAALRERAMQLLEFVTLDGHAHQAAGELSGGQCKLLELARVLMGEPRAILLDEPTAGVNPTLREVLADKIHSLNASGMTFFVIEHDMDFVVRHCAPVIAMHRGRVIFEGSANAARHDPRLLDAYLGDAAGD